MTEKMRMTRDIHNFVYGEMDLEGAIDLLGKVSQSEEWIDYLLMEMELDGYFISQIEDPAEMQIRPIIGEACTSY